MELTVVYDVDQQSCRVTYKDGNNSVTVFFDSRLMARTFAYDLSEVLGIGQGLIFGQTEFWEVTPDKLAEVGQYSADQRLHIAEALRDGYPFLTSWTIRPHWNE